MLPMKTLLRHVVDYAGLYPPAALPLPEVLRNYAKYQHSEGKWMLGRLVVSSSHLPAFQNLRPALPPCKWPLSVLVNTPEDWALVSRGLNSSLPIRAIETRAQTLEDVQSIADHCQTLNLRDVYIEVPLDRKDLLEAIKGQGFYAKARTGGLVQSAFPGPESLLQFIQDCVDLELPFKLTAGLHHPVRGQYRLTYQQNSEKGTMYGYLNVLLATAFTLQNHHSLGLQALLEQDQSKILWTLEGVQYAGVALNSSELSRTRALLHSFGSCSFTEPHDELLPLAHQ